MMSFFRPDGYTSARSGYTFIEIIVATTLLLLLSGLLVASYSGFNNTQIIKQAALTLKNNLRAIRTNAATGIKPEGCDELIGYSVDFPTESVYTATAICNTPTGQEAVGAVQTYMLPTTVTFVPLPQSVIFYALDRGASREQIITLTGNDTTASISILLSGTIDMYGGTPTP